MTITKTVFDLFKKIELIKKGNTIIGLKNTDIKAKWEILENELYKLSEQSNINLGDLLNSFNEHHQHAELQFRLLIKAVNLYKEEKNKKDAGKFLFRFITHEFSHENNIEIVEWDKCKELELTDKFVSDFLSLMNLREKYIYQIIKEIKAIKRRRDSSLNSQKDLKSNNSKNKEIVTWENIFQNKDIANEIFDLIKKDISFTECKAKGRWKILFSMLYELGIINKVNREDRAKIILNKFNEKLAQSVFSNNIGKKLDGVEFKNLNKGLAKYKK